ncbi:Variant-specific surface protein, partial [Giardia duodenalis]
VLGDSARWASLLLLQPVLHWCSAGHFLFMDGCYDARAAPGSGVCREARDGACVMHKEEDKTDKTSAKVGATGVEETPTCEAVTDSTPVSKKCAQNKCDVTIGGSQYCSQCSKPDEYLIDGACTAQVGTSGCKLKGSADGTCESCGAGYFLHKGGCYAQATPPGQTICQTAGSDGTCTTCSEANGYFKNPEAAATTDSCISCSDTTGVAIGESNTKTYKGVAGCAKCTASGQITEPTGGTKEATCTECNANLYLKTVTGDTPTTSCVDESTCKEGSTHFPTTDSTASNKKVCVSCGDNTKGGIDNCGKCSLLTPASRSSTVLVTCTKCGSDKYLKADGTCVDNCASDSTEFAKEDDVNGNRCVLCGDQTDGIADCKTCSNAENTLKCSACNNGKKPNTTGAACVACSITDCASCDKKDVCEACTSSKKLTPTGQCVDDCGKLGSYYADNNVCKPCSPECASCTAAGASKCLSCPAGKVLKYTSESNPSDGTCVDECKTNTGGCDTCGAVIGGSKYCSKCSTSSEYPVNGVCKASTARAGECQTPDNQGGCSVCASGYFLLDGGCYETSRQPGKSVCTTESGGKCSQCANSLNPDGNGVCPACPAGCSTCSNTNTCTACLAGYYLSSSKCVKCDTDDSNIKGVPNCVSCAAPTSNTGTVTCYVTQEPTADPTDPSVNKTGLSSGTVAGISVAVIAVVGGLVGFLCWWFVCHTKK